MNTVKPLSMIRNSGLYLNTSTILAKEIRNKFPLNPIDDKINASILHHEYLNNENVELTEQPDIAEKVQAGKTAWFKYSWLSNVIELDSIHGEAEKKLDGDKDLTAAVEEVLNLAIKREMEAVLFHLAWGIAGLIVHVISRCGCDKSYVIQSQPVQSKAFFGSPLKMEYLGIFSKNDLFVTLTKMTQHWSTTIEAEALCSINIVSYSA